MIIHNLALAFRGKRGRYNSKENEGDLVKKLPADVPFAVKQDALANRVTRGNE